MKIATWNINSVRLRIGLVERFIDEAMPDGWLSLDPLMH